MAFPVISTYRVQMRGRSNGFGFTFADAENLLDYLDDLGVSHLYLSPILTAVGGSTHGYDVTDPTTVSPELGGSDGLARLSAAARSRGMGLIVDIVPSHVGVGKPEQNAWWWDVLKFGRSSAYAEFFDIDWELGDGRIILPLLGSDSDVANLRVDGDLLRLGDLALPVAPGSGDGTGPAVHDRQHYRLVGWRHGLCGKRGEDVRARIGVLSQVPWLWAKFIGHAQAIAPAPDAVTGQFLWQNVFGVWPVSGEVSAALRGRLHTYAEKAIREAAWHTSWHNPNRAFEDDVHGWLDLVLDGPLASELTGLVAHLNSHAESDALAAKLLALTVPGVPDVYQGSELWDDSLVDPDNRRPVDYGTRRVALKALQHPKIRVLAAALRLRRTHPESFLGGAYHPVFAAGPAADHVVAFRRGDDILVAVTRWTVRLQQTGWDHTVLPLPDGSWTDALTGFTASGHTPAVELFADLPVVLLVRDNA